MIKKIRVALELIRIEQWVKNVFVLAPLAFTGTAIAIEDFSKILLGFIAFCFLSSTAYVFNDIQDIQNDRDHLKKCARPLPSGRITIAAAGGILLSLLVLAVLTLLILQPPKSFIGILAAYFILNVGYSLGLKNYAILDLFLVSSGYILRLLGGAIISNVILTHWIIACTGTITLMLVTVKRRGDLAQANLHQVKRASLRGYTIPFLDFMAAILASATIITYLLFSISDYATTKFGEATILSAVPVTMGIFRLLQIMIVDNSGEDPTKVILNDRILRYIIISWVLLFATLIKYT